ncbi:MAG: T4SS efffector SepA family protein [Xanthobacteraceae bacterium]
MVPSVELSAQTFARLQAHAVPLVDNIETVIGRLIDFYESRDGAPVPTTDDGAGGKVRQFNPLSPPSLTHTKVLAIEFCGRLLEHGQANWNGLLNAAVRTAKSRAKTAADLKQFVIIPYLDGQKTDEGYRYLPELGLSVQGQAANGAWKAACHIAQKLGLPLTVRFVWREKDGAAFPGITGQFTVQGR